MQQNERDGLMPNLFPEGKNEPMYNTVDAALLFINCVYLYYEATRDMDFVREVLSGDGTDHDKIPGGNETRDPDGRRRADPGRRRPGPGDLDGCPGGRNPSDAKTRQTGGDQCLLV